MYYFCKRYSAEELIREGNEAVDVKFVGTASVHECGTGGTVRAWSTGPFAVIEIFREEDAGDRATADIITSVARPMSHPLIDGGIDDIDAFGKIMADPAVIKQVEAKDYTSATVRPDRDLFQDWGDIDLGDSGDDFYG